MNALEELRKWIYKNVNTYKDEVLFTCGWGGSMSDDKRCGSCKHASDIGGGVRGCDGYLGESVCAMPVHVEPPYDYPCDHYESVSYESD